MNQISKLIFYVSRLLSLAIAFVVFGFMTEGLSNVTIMEKFFAALLMIVVAFVVVVYALKTKKTRLLAVTPIAYWFAILLFFIFGKYAGDFNVLQFIFLSLVTSSATLLAYYSWGNPQMGGIFYLALAALYLFISFNEVDTSALITVTTILLLTGALFVVAPTNQDGPMRIKPVNKGWLNLKKVDDKPNDKTPINS